MSEPLAPNAAPRTQPSPVAVALAWLLVVLGVLWIGLTGLCTLAVLTMNGGNARDLANLAPTVLMIGAPSIVPGGLLLWGGIAMLRAQRKARDS